MNEMDQRLMRTMNDVGDLRASLSRLREITPKYTHHDEVIFRWDRDLKSLTKELASWIGEGE